MKRLSLATLIVFSALAAASVHGAEPTFQKLESGKAANRSKPLQTDPANAPSQTVLTAAVQPDGSLLSQCQVEPTHGKARRIHLEHQQ